MQKLAVHPTLNLHLKFLPQPPTALVCPAPPPPCRTVDIVVNFVACHAVAIVVVVVTRRAINIAVDVVVRCAVPIIIDFIAC
jgi:hypothetical protein